MDNEILTRYTFDFENNPLVVVTKVKEKLQLVSGYAIT